MLPIGGPLQAPGPVTEEMQEKLRKIRFCVIGTFFAAIGRFCTGDIPGSELLSGIVGIFLLNDDPNVAPCYACLASSPLGQCSVAHGLSCAMTYAFLAGMNAIFLMLKLFTGGPFILVSFGFQASGAYLGMKLNAMIAQTAQTAPLATPGPPPPPSVEAPQFQAFRGTGMRLGG